MFKNIDEETGRKLRIAAGNMAHAALDLEKAHAELFYLGYPTPELDRIQIKIERIIEATREYENRVIKETKHSAPEYDPFVHRRRRR